MYCNSTRDNMAPLLQEAYDQLKAKEARFLQPYHQRIEQEIKRRERRKNGHIDPRIKRQMYTHAQKVIAKFLTPAPYKKIYLTLYGLFYQNLLSNHISSICKKDLDTC